MIGVSKMIIKKYASHGGSFIDSQYLGNAFDTVGKPYMFNTMLKLFSAQSRFFTSKLVLGATGGKAFGKQEIDTEVYRWHLQGSEEKFCRSVENMESANTAVGLNNTTFRFKLDVDYFHRPDVLMPEDNEYMIEIVDGPFADATGAVYVGRLQGDSPAQFMSNTLFDSGREFSKVTTAIQSEYNQVFGTQQYGSRFMLEAQVGAFGQEVLITDKAWREDGRLDIEFSYEDAEGNTKKATKFLPMAEAKMHEELYRSMEVAMMYGKKSTKPSTDGYWIKTGSGYREQLKDSWQDYYSTALTTTRLTDHFLNIFFTRKDETDRKVVGITGTYGLTKVAPLAA